MDTSQVSYKKMEWHQSDICGRSFPSYDEIPNRKGREGHDEKCKHESQGAEERQKALETDELWDKKRVQEVQELPLETEALYK